MSMVASVSDDSVDPSVLEAERQEAWAEYYRAHPEVRDSWSHSAGYWPLSSRRLERWRMSDG